MSAAQAVPVAMAAAAGLALGWAWGERSARRQAAAMDALLDRALAALTRTNAQNTQTAGGFGGVGGASSTPPGVTHAKEPPQTPFAAVLEGGRKMPPGAGSEPDCEPPSPGAVRRASAQAACDPALGGGGWRCEGR